MPTRALRCCGLLAVTVGLGAVLSVSAPTPVRLATALQEVANHPRSTVDGQGVESVAITVVATLAWFALAWLVLALILVGAAAAPGRLGAVATAVSAVLVPATTRQVLAAALGVTLMTGVSAGAAAASPRAPAPAPTAVSALDLDWPAAPSATATPPSPPPGNDVPDHDNTDHDNTDRDVPDRDVPDRSVPDRSVPGGGAPDRTVVVRYGDSLWTIVARHLGPGATDEQIAYEWPRWWSANHHIVGTDPDRIMPGQRLTPPAQP
jgi:nucleoid-associated protein YgaU